MEDIESQYPPPDRFDIVWRGNDHFYWSEHCRHASWPPVIEDGHSKCPARCVVCRTTCKCPCHKARES